MTAFQVYAFCEGMWRSFAWLRSVDLTSKVGTPKIEWKPAKRAV